MAMTVIGHRKTSFKPQDSNESISGYNIYVMEEMDPKNGEGHMAERLFMTTEKLLACGYNPTIGDEVKVEYNRFGKPSAITLVQ